MIIKTQTVETIKYALNMLLDINKSIVRNSNNKERLHRVIADIEKDHDALNDLEQLLNSFGRGQTENGQDVYFYL